MLIAIGEKLVFLTCSDVSAILQKYRLAKYMPEISEGMSIVFDVLNLNL